MQVQRKKVLIVAGGAVALTVIAAIIGILLFDINSYKSRIEIASSEAIGLDIRINSKMGLSYFPFGLSANDIHVANKGVEILSLEKLKLGVKFISLLKGQLKIISCELYKPTISIMKDIEGNFNFENAEKKPPKTSMDTGFSLKKFRLSRGILVYLAKKPGENTTLEDINLAIDDLLLADIAGDILKNVSFTGRLDCKEVQKGDLKFYNIKSLIKAEKGVIRFMPLTMDALGGKGGGDAAIDKSGMDIVYKVNLKVSQLDFANLEESFGVKRVIGGKGDLEASLTMVEKGNLSLMNGIGGNFFLRGEHLIIYTMDLDEVLSTYETSQEFNLVDLGAFFIAGPLSTVGLKGYRYWEVYNQAQKGQGDIKNLISIWKIKNGIAHAIDCALATQHNRVALTGNLNFVSKRYDDVTVALLDDRGCAKFKQSLTGPFESPEVGAVSAFETLGGPIFNLYRKTKRFIQRDKCEAFYDGSVRQP